MSLFLTVGVAHHDVPISRLERVAAVASDRARVQARALAAGCAEVLVLSTCSRIELHAVVEEPPADDPDEVPPAQQPEHWSIADRLLGVLLDGISEPVGPATVAVGDDAVRHLYRVAAGLDSRIVGETEVQAQLRSAARAAQARHGEPHRLRRLVTAAVAAARETAVEQPAVLRRGLLAGRAVERALSGRPDGAPVEALVVGAGAMGRAVCRSLARRACRATLLSRTTSARPGGPDVHPLDELPDRLARADVLFVATSAGRRILSAGLVGEVMAARAPQRPLTIVDLSLPRNVDPAVRAVPGVHLLDLDDLADRACGATVDQHALGAAEVATGAAAWRYCAQLRSRRAGPMINALRSRVQQTCLDQLRRTAKGTGLPDEALARMAAAVAGAVAHSPTVLAREAAAAEDLVTLELLAAAFRVPPPAPPTPAGMVEMVREG